MDLGRQSPTPSSIMSSPPTLVHCLCVLCLQCAWLLACLLHPQILHGRLPVVTMFTLQLLVQPAVLQTMLAQSPPPAQMVSGAHRHQASASCKVRAHTASRHIPTGWGLFTQGLLPCAFFGTNTILQYIWARRDVYPKGMRLQHTPCTHESCDN